MLAPLPLSLTHHPSINDSISSLPHFLSEHAHSDPANFEKDIYTCFPGHFHKNLHLKCLKKQNIKTAKSPLLYCGSVNNNTASHPASGHSLVILLSHSWLNLCFVSSCSPWLATLCVNTAVAVLYMLHFSVSVFSQLSRHKNELQFILDLEKSSLTK